MVYDMKIFLSLVYFIGGIMLAALAIMFELHILLLFSVHLFMMSMAVHFTEITWKR